MQEARAPDRRHHHPQGWESHRAAAPRWLCCI